MQNFRMEDMIVYEDRELLVCRKPAGIAVQNARFGTPDLESMLKNYLAAAAGADSRKAPYLAVIHRLDQPVEGILVFAKKPDAARELSRQMAEGRMEKTYLAVTDRVPAVSEGQLRDFLKKDGRTNTSCVVREGTAGSKEARLTYRVLEEIPDAGTTGGRRCLVKIRLDTGRHHQIRVQMAHAGMPLLGDRKYYPEDKTGFPLGLCSCALRFAHPSTKKEMKFEIRPAGEAFAGFTRDCSLFLRMEDGNE